MDLTTLVGILEGDLSGGGDLSSSRRNLAKLYADRGHHDRAAEQRRIASARRRRQATKPRGQQSAAGLAASLYEQGKFGEAKREAERALAAGPGAELVDGLKWIIAKTSKAAPKRARARRTQ